jgi:GNAT superfamily N-acetyltransferase
METPLVRRANDADRDVIMAMADRLQEGVAAWRDPRAVLDAVRGWVHESLEALSDPDRAVFVAERQGRVIGFATVSERTHFAGDVDAYIGELVVSKEAEGQGVGRALVGAAEDWAHSRGRKRIAVDTGAANSPARRFYAALGFAPGVAISITQQGRPRLIPVMERETTRNDGMHRDAYHQPRLRAAL